MKLATFGGQPFSVGLCELCPGHAWRGVRRSNLEKLVKDFLGICGHAMPWCSSKKCWLSMGKSSIFMELWMAFLADYRWWFSIHIGFDFFQTITVWIIISKAIMMNIHSSLGFADDAAHMAHGKLEKSTGSSWKKGAVYSVSRMEKRMV